VLLMPGNRGISLEMAGACVENVETVGDSQELMTVSVKTSLCDQKHPALTKPGLGPFQGSAAHKIENVRKKEEDTKRAVGESK
jgi:hypothetical protein